MFDALCLAATSAVVDRSLAKAAMTFRDIVFNLGQTLGAISQVEVVEVLSGGDGTVHGFDFPLQGADEVGGILDVGLESGNFVGHSCHTLAEGLYIGQEPASRSSFQVSGHRERLIKAFRLILTEPSIDFDQLILYPNFIHVSYVSKVTNRHYIMTAQDNGKYHRVTRENALALN